MHHPVGRRSAAASLFLLAWVVLNFGWTLGVGLTNDDFMWIYGAGLGATGDWTRIAWSPIWRGFVRPLVQMSFVFNFSVSGMHPLSYHLVNVALHAANTILLWRLVLCIHPSRAIALVTALAFAVHPTRSEAVTWVSGRTELLCAAFYLSALILHVRRRTQLALLLFALALGSKETAVSLPFAVLAAEHFGFRDERRRYLRALPYFGVLAGYLAVRAALVRNFTAGILGPGPGISLPPGLYGSFRQKITLLGQFLFEPFPLHGFLRSALVLGLGVIAVLVWTRVARRANRRAARFALAWTGIAFLPYAGWFWLTPWYLYLPTAATSLLVTTAGADVLCRLPEGWYRKTAIAAAVLIWLGTSTYRLQVNNEQQRRAGILSQEVLRNLVAAAPSPASGTVFAISGLSRMRLGGDPWTRTAVFLAGLPEAVRLRYADRSLDARFVRNAAAARRELIGRHPSWRHLIFLHWRGRQRGFQQLPPPS